MYMMVELVDYSVLNAYSEKTKKCKKKHPISFNISKYVTAN